MYTYTGGIRLEATRDITKNDIITMCNLLNRQAMYTNLCTFSPEPITEGGIVFNFNEGSDGRWYKTMRLHIKHRCGEWPWINPDTVMSEWDGNQDILVKEGAKFGTILKSFHGAPVFTLEELKIWEMCFLQIDIERVGKYPTKRSLAQKGVI